MESFELGEELPSFEQFDDKVDGVVGLIDLHQLHEAVMVELPHNLNLVDQRLPALLLRQQCLLTECLDGELTVILLTYP